MIRIGEAHRTRRPGLTRAGRVQQADKNPISLITETAGILSGRKAGDHRISDRSTI